MTETEKVLFITAKLYEEKLEKVLSKAEFEDLEVETARYLMINALVRLPWTSPFSQMIKKQFHITENDVKAFFKKFPSLEEDNGKPACDLQFDDKEEEEEEPEETINILNDCAGCVFYNPDDDCCENNARICTYKEED